MGDLGIRTTDKIIEDLKEKIKERHIKEPSECRKLLIESIKAQMQPDEHAYDFENEKSIVLVIGVNGVGKTTSIGKLASNLKADGKKVILAAADTFRAAAIDQLSEWAKRNDIEMIAQNEGSDPASVVYDAIAACKNRDADILICDTAGRLHNKKNLMEELKKICRVVERELPEADFRKYLVLDATTGQNGVMQAEVFSEAIDLDGIVLTKLDGTAKGGVVLAISAELELPVLYVGVGEKIDDLIPFDAKDFVDALI